MRLKRLAYYLCFVFMALVVWPLTAQNPAGILNKPTYTGDYLLEFDWIPSSTRLQIEDEPYDDGPSTWLVYEAETKTFLFFDRFAPSEMMTQLADHPTAPLVLYDSVARTGLVYVSPDERFAVYAAYPRDDKTEAYGIALADLMTGEAHLIEGLGTRDPFSTGKFQVRWSDNNRAFYVMLDYGPVVLYYYVTGFQENIDQARLLPLTDQHVEEETGVFRLTNYTLYMSEVYDIDPSGQFLLIDGIQTSEDKKAFHGLMILDIATLTGEEVTDHAMFANFTDDATINYITHDGVFEYDSIEHTTRLRNPSINTNWVSRAAFSPDGRHAAVLIRKYTQPDELYVLEIEPDASSPQP